jgi:uncharacterized membrane protein
MLREPDWLREPRGPDVLAAMRSHPIVIFWPVTPDMAFATKVPAMGTCASNGPRLEPRSHHPPGWTLEGSPSSKRSSATDREQLLQEIPQSGRSLHD